MIGFLRRILARAVDPDDLHHPRETVFLTGADIPHLPPGYMSPTPIAEPDPTLGMRTDRSDDPTVHNNGRPTGTSPAPRRQATPTRPHHSQGITHRWQPNTLL